MIQRLLGISKASPPLPTSFYDLTATAANGSTIHFSSFRSKVVYCVNTASC